MLFYQTYRYWLPRRIFIVETKDLFHSRTVWRDNPFLTTTPTQHLRGLSEGGCTEIPGWWKRTGQERVNDDQGVAEMGGVTESLHSGDSAVNCLNPILYLILDHLIVQWITYSISPICWSHLLFPRLCVDIPNCVHPHSQVVSYLLTLCLYTSSQNSSFTQIPFRKSQEVLRILTIGSVPSRSAISPGMEPKHGYPFRKLSKEWWERPLLANMGIYGEKQPIKDTFHISGGQCRRK